MDFKTLNKNEYLKWLYIRTVDVTKSGSDDKLLGVLCSFIGIRFVTFWFLENQYTPIYLEF
jgi:hypothetical protein